ncbi:hypothetical protein GXV22_005346, partial [Escherichia coli]|nr:hypothetical protein [Escherichia coli]EFI6127551.1 hypothetical protein [Escherichia coli]
MSSIAFASSTYFKVSAPRSSSSRQPGGCGLSWSGITVIKKDNVIVFQVVI